MCNARASWPTPTAGHLITLFGQLAEREENSTCGFWNFKGGEIAVIGFCLCGKNFRSPVITFSRASLRTLASCLQSSRRRVTFSRLTLFSANSSPTYRKRREKKITQPQWLGDLRLQLEWSPLSDVGTIFDVAGFHKRITAGETVQSNVVVFDFGIKGGDF
ncbi:hypothetical protein BH18ACI4_BH18ACI4_06490 [soil metagenome]